MIIKLLDDGLHAVSDLGVATHRHHAIGTRIIETYLSGDYVIVLEDYYRFPQSLSNLYCLDSELRTVWSAERPSSTDAYVGSIKAHEGNVRCGSWEGWACIIDPKTGRILERLFTK